MCIGTSTCPWWAIKCGFLFMSFFGYVKANDFCVHPVQHMMLYWCFLNLWLNLGHMMEQVFIVADSTFVTFESFCISLLSFSVSLIEVNWIQLVVLVAFLTYVLDISTICPFILVITSNRYLKYGNLSGNSLTYICNMPTHFDFQKWIVPEAVSYTHLTLPTKRIV